MKISSFLLAALIALSFSSPSFAAGYVPIGPKVYTPQPDIITPQDPTVTPQAPTVTTTGGGYTGAGSNEPHIGPSPAKNGRGWWNEKCQTIALVNDDCTVLSLNPGTGGNPIPLVTTSTANPDLVMLNPDLVTPQPPTCKQFGFGHSGFGSYSC